MEYKRQAILKTLLYSDLFSFPLTRDELWQYLISPKSIDKKDFLVTLQSLVGREIIYKHGYYALAGKKDAISMRRKNVSELDKKLLIASHAAYYLSFIPTISFIGISGGVAVGNADASSDIDLFIITKSRTLYTTRLWVLATLELLQLRRKKNDPNPANKVCANLFLDERNLAWDEQKRDIFIAHEIAQIKPLFERRNMYHLFLSRNDWIKKYLPNISKRRLGVAGSSWMRNYFSLSMIGILLTFAPWEYLMAVLQKRVMKSGRTVEVVTDMMLAFHPTDYRKNTLRLWQKTTQQSALLTNK